MRESLSKEQVKEYLSIFKIKPEYVYYSQFDAFIKKYGNNNNFSENWVDSLCREISIDYFKVDDEKKYEFYIEKFSSFFSKEKYPIYWFSDDFWNLISIKETLFCSLDWKSGRFNTCLSKEEKVGIVNFFKKYNKENTFEHLSNYLESIYANNGDNYELVNYWFSLAIKKENKKKLKGKPIPSFIEILNNVDKLTYKLRVVELYSLFETQEGIEKLKEMKEKNLNNAILQEAIHNKLTYLGVENELPNYDLLVKEEESVIYVNSKIINPQFILQNKIANKNEVEKFLKLITFYISNKLKVKGVNTEIAEKDYWIKKLDSEEKVLEIKAFINFNFQREEVDTFLKNVINIGVNNFLKNDKHLLRKYDIEDYHEATSFLYFFDEYIEKVSLFNNISDKIETDNLNKVNTINMGDKIKSPKNKI